MGNEAEDKALGKNIDETLTFNEIRNLLILYCILFVIYFFIKHFVSLILSDLVILLPIYFIILWLVFKYFRKSKKILGYIALILFTFPYGLIFLIFNKDIKVIRNNETQRNKKMDNL